MHRFLQRLVLVAIKTRDSLSIGLPIVSGSGAASTTAAAAVAVAVPAATGAGAGSGFSTILGIGRIHCLPDGMGNGFVSEYLECSIREFKVLKMVKRGARR